MRRFTFRTKCYVSKRAVVFLKPSTAVPCHLERQKLPFRGHDESGSSLDAGKIYIYIYIERERERERQRDRERAFATF
jgi:hypothetical protein